MTGEPVPPRDSFADVGIPSDFLRGMRFGPIPRSRGKRCVFYCRYSSLTERETSIDRQVANARAYVTRIGGRLVEDRFLYADRAKSGGSMHGRTALKELLDDGAAGKFDYVICEDFDRLTRDQADGAVMHREFERLGIELHATTWGRIGPMELAMLSFTASEQRKRIAAVTTQGRWLAASRGRWPTGASYGYASTAVPGEVKVDETQANIVRRIFELYDEGLGCEAIAALLNSQGIPGPSGRMWRVEVIRGWAGDGSGILRNLKYKGVLAYGRMDVRRDPDSGRIVRNLRHPSRWVLKHKPEWTIVDPELFDRVVRKLGRNARIPRPAPKATPTCLLEPAYRCSCGAEMRHFSAGPGKAGKLKCLAGSTHEAGHRRSIVARYPEREVLRMIRDEIVGPEAVAVFGKEYAKQRNAMRGKLHSTRVALENRIEELTASLLGTFDAARTKGIDEARLVKIRVRLEDELGACETELRDLPDLAAVPRSDAGMIERLRAKLAEVAEAPPMIISDEDDQIFLHRLRSLVHQVEIDLREDCYTLVVDAHLAGLLGASGEIMPLRRIVRTFPSPTTGRGAEPDRHDAVVAVAEDGRYDMSDADWSSIADRFRHSGGEKPPIRTFIDGLLLSARTGQPLTRLPDRYGTYARIKPAVAKLLAGAGLAEAFELLVDRDSRAVAGMPTERLERFRKRLRKLRRPRAVELR